MYNTGIEPMTARSLPSLYHVPEECQKCNFFLERGLNRGNITMSAAKLSSSGLNPKQSYRLSRDIV